MKHKLSVLAALGALFVLMTASGTVLESCRYGLRLCVELILPSLFPFFVVSGVLSRLGFPRWLGAKLAPLARRLFHVSGPGATALAIGLCGGYPMGAAYLAELLREGTVEEQECSRLLAFCNNSGPAFFLGSIGGGVFHSARLGLLLYGVHAAAAVLTGLLLRGPDVRSVEAPVGQASPPSSFSSALTESVNQAVTALLSVCGFVVCFTVFTGLLDANGFLDAAGTALTALFPVEPQAVRALLTGFFEIGGGIGALRGLPPTAGSLALASALVGWGGLSVHFQTFSLFAEADVKSAPHTAGRLLNAVLSFLLTFGLVSLIPGT